VMEIPVRMRQTRMHSGPRESPPGFKCQTRSTSFTREPPKTKAELRQMLAEAVRNTQASADHGPQHSAKAKKDQG
jgi:hypothetical protein